jgi:DNA replication protein DnaC
MKKKIILFGRSGTGKDYLIDCFGLEKVKSYTTRLKRFNEFLLLFICDCRTVDFILLLPMKISR